MHQQSKPVPRTAIAPHASAQACDHAPIEVAARPRLHAHRHRAVRAHAAPTRRRQRHPAIAVPSSAAPSTTAASTSISLYPRLIVEAAGGPARSSSVVSRVSRKKNEKSKKRSSVRFGLFPVWAPYFSRRLGPAPLRSAPKAREPQKKKRGTGRRKKNKSNLCLEPSLCLLVQQCAVSFFFALASHFLFPFFSLLYAKRFFGCALSSSSLSSASRGASAYMAPRTTKVSG